MDMMKFIKGDAGLSASMKRKREIFLYLVFGGLTTLVNLLTFVVMDKLLFEQHFWLSFFDFSFDFKVVLNTTIAWVVAVLFAFFTNRSFVFLSKGPIFKELIGFVSSRIATLIFFEIGLLQLTIWIVESGLGIAKDSTLIMVGSFSVTYLYILKLVVSVFVVIGNYVLSKIFVFRSKTASDHLPKDGDK